MHTPCVDPLAGLGAAERQHMPSITNARIVNPWGSGWSLTLTHALNHKWNDGTAHALIPWRVWVVGDINACPQSSAAVQCTPCVDPLGDLGSVGHQRTPSIISWKFSKIFENFRKFSKISGHGP